MVLASVVSTSQTGSLELLATQLNNPPALANNSGSTVTVSLTATGQWTLMVLRFVLCNGQDYKE
jgi:hypothetical protein